jgi:uncharacterized membrane protein YphA (DoxX/SURF4 family)
MKKTKIMYWIFTALLVVLMGFGSIPDLMYLPDAVALFDHLGYPAYLLPFLAVAKLLGIAVILIPGFPRIKEWAYAGLTFDLVGATYSSVAVGDPAGNWAFMFIGFAIIAGSYVCYHRKQISTSSRQVTVRDLREPLNT